MHLQTLALLGLVTGSCYGQNNNIRRLRYRALNATAATVPTGPTGASIASAPTGTGPSASICGSPTLNVLTASLDWWYGRTLYDAVSTFSIQFNSDDQQTGWTLLPATTTFNIDSAIETETCSFSLTYNTQANTSLWGSSCGTAPTPVAASTTVITQTAYIEPTATTGTGLIPDVVSTPPPATLSVPSFTTYAASTAFVYFSSYEIIYPTPTTYSNGSVGCSESTSTYPMATPFAFEYSGADVNGTEIVGAGVTGDVAPALLGLVGQTTAVAGSWVAAPTVAIVVQKIFAAEAVLAATAGVTAITASTLLTPTPTPGFPSPTQFPSPTGFTGTGVIQSTAGTLDIPTLGPTPKPPSGPTPGQNGNPQPAPTPVPVNTQGGGGGGGGGGGSSTQIGGGSNTPIGGGQNGGAGVQPQSNALGVLTQAQASIEQAQGGATALPEIVTAGPGNSNQNGGSGSGGNGGSAGSQANGVLVVGGTTVTADSNTAFNFGSAATLTPGGTAVIAGTTLSFMPGGSTVVVNGQTRAISGAQVTAAPAVTIGGTVYQPTGGSTYVIDGQTLTPGGVIVDAGTTISLGEGASSIVVNGVTREIGSGPNVGGATTTGILGGTPGSSGATETGSSGGSTSTNAPAAGQGAASSSFQIKLSGWSVIMGTCLFAIWL